MEVYQRVRMYLLPSLSDCLFISVMIWLFVSGCGWLVLLADGDTGWHIRTGEYILNTRSIPVRDLFSFSRAGAPWFSWEWLADVIFAVAHGLAGLKGVVLLSGTMISASAAVLFRHMVWQGANLLAALILTFLALGASSIHYLARPHLFTLLLIPISAWIVDSERRSTGPAIWILVPLSALWANLHGGFPAVFVFPGCLVADALAKAVLDRSRASFQLIRRYLTLTLCCFAATSLNPYGWRLHRHIASYLNSDWILRTVDEFHSPNFRTESMFQFEILLFAGLSATAVLISKRKFYEALLILFWSQAALRSVRHVPIFVLIAVPIVAVEATRLWSQWTESKPRRSIPGILRDLLAEFPRHCRHTSLWPAALCVFLTFGSTNRSWPKDFPDNKFPCAAVNRNYAIIGGTGSGKSHVLTSDQWGGYLIYRMYPRQRVFVDGRSDFYGPSLGKDYLDLMNAQSGWRKLLQHYDFELALIPVNWSLAELLRNDAGWHERYRDSLAVIFERNNAKAN